MIESVNDAREQDISPTSTNERPRMWNDIVPAEVFENAPLSKQCAGYGHDPSTSKKSALKETLPKTTFDPAKTGAQWPKRAKASLQSVDLGRMTTVQEACLDSREWNE
ncbi:MAG: hypothetical protein Q9169_000228 [Polycauliona sp. 2 TL-2023]